MELTLIIVIMLAIGFVAGIIAGLLGVGGGIILVPAFYYVFSWLGYDNAYLMQICVATSLATIIVTSVRSTMAHHQKGAVDWDTLRGWAPGIAIGAVVGVVIAGRSSSAALMVVFGVLGLLVGMYMAFGRENWRLGEQMPTGLTRGILSPLVGFLSVLMGIGGGSFGVPLMTLFNRPIHRAVATAAGFGILIAVPSVIGFLMFKAPDAGRPPLTVGLVNLPAFAIIVLMTMLSAPLGARLAHAMDPKPLKRVFAVFIAVMAANMLRKALTG